MDGTVQQVLPECPVCQQELLTVSHVLTECLQLRYVRTRFFKPTNPSIETLIRDGSVHSRVAEFFKYVGMWDVI